MNVYTWDEVLANRKTWIEFLKNPILDKACGVLDLGRNNKRCCLGHACYVLGATVNGTTEFGSDTCLKYDNTYTDAPIDVQMKLGLKNSTGEFINRDNRDQAFYITVDVGDVFSLAYLNDTTNLTPQEIGAFIEKHYDVVFLDELEYEARRKRI